MSGFIGGWNWGVGKAVEQASHSSNNRLIINQFVGYIYKSDIESCALGHGVLEASEAISLADAAAHGDAVDGMAQTLLGHADEEGDRRVAVSAGVVAPHGAQRPRQGCRSA